MIICEQAQACCLNFEDLEPDDVLRQIGEPTGRGKVELETLIDGTIPVAHYNHGEVTHITPKKDKTPRERRQIEPSAHAKARSKERGISTAEINEALQAARGKRGCHTSAKGVTACVVDQRGKGQVLATVYRKKPA